MKKAVLILFGLVSLALLVFIITSDPHENKFNHVEVKGKLSLEVPAYLTRTDSIDPSALLQFKNEREEIFLLVHELNDSAALETLFKKVSDEFVSKLDEGSLAKYYPLTVNGSNALVGDIRGKMSGEKVFYKLALIQTEHSFLKILFGVSENYRLDDEEDMDKAIRSVIVAGKRKC